MLSNNFQRGFLTVFFSVGSDPMKYWEIHTKNGYCKRVVDEDIKSIVLELMGANVSTLYITSPPPPFVSLGVKMPFLVFLLKNLHKYFTFEVKIIDDQKFYRRFRVSNFQSKTVVKPFSTAMPMGMSNGWNQVHFNLADFTRRAYGTNYIETVRITINANIRVRRIYFSDRLYTEEDLPNEYRLLAKPKQRPIYKEYKVPAARPPSPAKSGNRSVPSSAKTETETDPTGPSSGEPGETTQRTSAHVSVVEAKSESPAPMEIEEPPAEAPPPPAEGEAAEA